MNDFNQQFFHKKNQTVIVFEVLSLVLAIINLGIAFIPCVGILAIPIGIISITISAIGLYIAHKASAQKGLLIAALAIGLVGTAISVGQIVLIKVLGESSQKESRSDAIYQNDSIYDNDSINESDSLSNGTYRYNNEN